MRCYTVDETAIRGIHLVGDESGLFVGDARMPLDEGLCAQLAKARLEIQEELLGAAEGGHYAGEALTSEECAALYTLAGSVGKEHVRLIYADVKDGKIVKDSRRESDALVLVETSAGIGGKIFFMSTSFDEYYDRRHKRIRRKYRHEFPPPGVEVLAESSSSDSGKCYLLRMKLGSSFRIERTGRLDGIPRILIVSWKGQRDSRGAAGLEVYSPLRSQEQDQEPEQVAQAD